MRSASDRSVNQQDGSFKKREPPSLKPLPVILDVPRVIVNSYDFERIILIFRNRVQKSGVLKEYRNHRHFQSRTERRRRKDFRAAMRRSKRRTTRRAR